ncbi:unnamed protein product [Cyprideis torosa]|uniref:long-chain-fatty-acid--CoA ligase n=1 Tax=Cyprideis torosa TaxID=163714 RepID=A0A7R8WN42_9CRUS|nr:unnamed protein product [Cyprideis torosa]CAG0900226.1 unnamed protein product [Cyprideis torosa]
MRQFETKNQSVVHIFEETVQRHPDKAACIFEGKTWTFRQVSNMGWTTGGGKASAMAERGVRNSVDDLSNQIANFFIARGILKGDVIAVFMENSPEYVCTWLGLAKAGITPALINYSLKRSQLLHCIDIVQSKALIFSGHLIGAVNEVSDDLQTLPHFVFGDPIPDGQSPTHPAISLSEELEKVDKDLPPREWTEKPSDGGKTSGRLKPTSRPNCFSRPGDRLPNYADKLLYIYTSGTTGMPKAAVIKHSRFLFFTSGAHFLGHMSPNDVIYDPLPLYHTAGGILGVGQVLIYGCTVVIRRNFSASRFWEDCRKHNCTVAQYIGEICRYLLTIQDSPEDGKHSVRLMFGNGLRPQIWKAFQERFKVPNIVEFYGSTEGNTTVINVDNRIGAVGFRSVLAPWVLPVSLIRVDEMTGEPMRDSNGLCIHCLPGEPGEFVGKIQRNHPVRDFHGYADESATKKKLLTNVFRKGDTCFRSGDILVMDEYGYLYFRDRTGDTFRWKGENVSTAEVEAVVSNIIGLTDCVVYGVEVPGTEGRAGMAAILDPEHKVDMAVLYTGIKENLPSFAQPIFVRKVEKLDATGTYKMKKVDLQKEGYAILGQTDHVYVLDHKAQAYVPLSEELLDDIKQGRRRL